VARPVLLFDGDCGFCRRWVEWAVTRGADVRFTPCRSSRGRAARAITARGFSARGITERDCRRTAWLIDGDDVRHGAAAINGVLAAMPTRRHRALARFGGWPGIRGVEEVGYRLVARNRHRFRGPRPPRRRRRRGGGG
jgi:predicted DCC family thiol-disulfide oxidoreductase YuxK